METEVKIKPIHTAIAAAMLVTSFGTVVAQDKPVIATVVKISGIPWFN